MSLCGGLDADADADGSAISGELFEQSKVTFDDFVGHLQVRF